jgi:hypothetical protein
MATIDNLSIQVTASAESAASALDRLASSAGGLRGAATRAGGGLRDLSAGAKDAGTATQEAGQQAGNAEKHTRDYGRAAEDAGKAAKRGTAGISSFWQALKRVAYYRFIRTIIKTITSAFSEGIKNIYSWSSAVNGHFAKSMNQLATATNYLKNSLGAMTAPLLEALAPVIDFVIDKVVALLNVFNQFFAALSGASTYTVAKKVAATWGDTTGGISSGVDDATESIKELKRTILGFDEINKLDKFKMTGSGGGGSGSSGGGSGSSGGGIEFEEKPLEGFFKDLHDITGGWPDWLKWLFGIGGIAIAGWGISLLPKLIGKIWDALKRLFGITIPDWFKWLFGPKGGGDIDIDIPDHIDIPDGKVKVDIEKGDWSALDEIPSEKTLTLKVGVKMDGWIGDQTQQDSLAVNGLSTINKQLERMVDNWDDLAWEVAQMPSGTIIDRMLSVAVKRSTNWDETAWDVANWEDGKVINISAAVALVKSWKGTALAALGLDNLSSNVYVKLVRSGWSTLAKYVGTYDANVYVKLVKSGWSSLAKYVGTYDANVYVKLVKSGWSSLAKYVGTYTANVKVVLKKDGWTDISSYLDNNFGGASGGGGKTSGGGAGRNNKYKVSVGLKDPTTTDTNTFWDRLGEAWNASVTAVDKGLDVVVRPVAKKTGGALSGFFSKVGEWLFGKSDTPETESKVKAVAGTGFSNVGSNGKMNLTGINDTDVTINLKAGNFSEGYKKWVTGDQWGDLNSTVYLKNGNFSDGFKKWLTGNIWADVNSSVYLKDGNFSDGFKKWLTGNIWADVNSSVYLKAGNFTSLSSWLGDSVTVSVNLKAGGGVAYSNGYSASFESGGVISNGVAKYLSNIPHYASGTTDAHGTLFLAGEAGPEILGHVGGRTEILNQSQLASTMFAAVRSAMTGVKIGGYIENAVTSGDIESDYETMYRAMYDAFTDAMTGSNERDKEKVALMRQIAAKEFTAEVTAASVNRAQTRMNRRAGTTIVPVVT